MKIFLGETDQKLINTFNQNTKDVNSAIERLTTGYKINSVKDDAATSAIISKMAVKLSASNIAETNIDIGMAMLSTAENTFAVMQSHMDRIRNLAVQAANEVYTEDQIKAIQLEINQRLDEVIRLQDTTEFNGMNLFCGKYHLDGNKTYVTDEITGVNEVNTPITFSMPVIRAVSDVSVLSSVLSPAPKALTTITIGVNKYDVTGVQGVDFDYTYDAQTDLVTFTGENVSVNAHSGQNNKIIFDINNGSYTASDGTTIITVNGDGNTINSVNGDDSIIISSTADKTKINGNKNVNLSITNNGSNTDFSQCIGFPENLPDSGFLNFSGNETIDVIIQDKEYSIKNNSTSSSVLTWDLNEFGEISISCHNFNIIAAANQSDKLIINGSNNSIDTADLDDIVTITGNNNIVNGGTGTDIVNLRSGFNETSSVEQINLSGSGQFVASSENILLNVGGKTYSIKSNGSKEVVEYSKSGTNFILSGNNLNIVSNNDTEKLNFRLNGNNNSISQLGIDEIISIVGSNNIINAVGIDNFYNIQGDTNIFNGSTGKDSVAINLGTNNTINTNAGNDVITVSTPNNIINAGDGDDVIFNYANNNLNGGSGIDTVHDSSINSSYSGIERISLNNNSGDFVLNNGESYEFVMGNFSYRITANTDTSFHYSYSTTAVMIDANGLTIDALNNSDPNLFITGNNNTINSGDAANNIVITGNNNNLVSGDGDNNITVVGNENTIKSGGGNDLITLNKGEDNKVDGGAGSDLILSYANNTIFTGIETIYQKTQDKNLQVGINSSENSVVKVSTGFLIGKTTIDVSTSELARRAIDTCDEISSEIVDKMLNLGASQNRLESALDANTVQITNLTSSLSTARDADVSFISSKFIQSQILQNATQTLMSVTRNFTRDSILGIFESL